MIVSGKRKQNFVQQNHMKNKNKFLRRIITCISITETRFKSSRKRIC